MTVALNVEAHNVKFGLFTLFWLFDISFWYQKIVENVHSTQQGNCRHQTSLLNPTVPVVVTVTQPSLSKH